MRIFLIFIFSCISVFSLHNAVANQNQIVKIATAEWQPYITMKNPNHGHFGQIVDSVFKQMNMQVEYVNAPWKRIETLLKNGDVFAGIPYSYTPERHQYFDYSLPLMNSQYGFFYLKSHYPRGINYQQLNDLKKYRIGGVIGYWYENLFMQNRLNIEYVATDEQGIIKLYGKRVDLIITDISVGWHLIDKLYPNQRQQFAVMPKLLGEQKLYLMISKTYPHSRELMQHFNQTLQQLRQHGQF